MESREITPKDEEDAGECFIEDEDIIEDDSAELDEKIIEWGPHKQMFHQMCSKIARFWWENCETEWLRDGLCEYFALFAVEVMLGIDEKMKYINMFEKNISSYNKKISIISLNVNCIDKEIVYRQKVPFLLRTLECHIGTKIFLNMLSD